MRHLAPPTLAVLLGLASLAVVVLSILERFGFKRGDGVTALAGLLAAVVVWWQGDLIREQIELQKKQAELQTIIDLDKEWNSVEMLRSRSLAWNDRNEPDKYRIEGALEFLEKVSTFQKNGALSDDLIWDTFGWYVWRYYYYSADVIRELRADWTPGSTDPTLYQDLEELYFSLLRMEVEERNRKRTQGQPELTEKDVLNELKKTRHKFITSERRLVQTK